MHSAERAGDQPLDSEFIALGEASRILKSSQEHARRLADDGTLHAIRLSNGHRIFRREDVQRVARERAARRGAAEQRSQ